MFVFGDFIVHHKDWLTYSGGTDRLGELCYNFLSQMTLLRWLTFLLRSPTVILTVQLFWIYFFLLTPVLVLQWLSLHWKFLIIDFPINSKLDTPIRCISYDYSGADWDGLGDHLRETPWEDIFKFSASAAVSEFCEWVQVGIDE